jgi:hypothetical protein
MTGGLKNTTTIVKAKKVESKLGEENRTLSSIWLLSLTVYISQNFKEVITYLEIRIY